MHTHAPSSTSSFDPRHEGVVWLSWQSHRRQREIASALGVELVEWPDLDERGHTLAKYIIGTARTIGWLVRRRPRVLICMSPSVVLATIATVFARLLGYSTIIDAHHAGLYPDRRRLSPMSVLARFSVRNADMCIVTNEADGAYVESQGTTAFVLFDKLPTIRGSGRDRHPGLYTVLFVCTYSSDEPYHEVLDALKLMSPERYRSLVTGNYRRAGLDPGEFPEHVRLTGFVPDEEYDEMVLSADILIDLTDRDDCLVCGAYEGIAAGCPLVLSDTDVNRALFRTGVVYTEHRVEAIAEAIGTVADDLGGFRDQVEILREELESQWNVLAGELQAHLHRLRSGSSVNRL